MLCEPEVSVIRARASLRRFIQGLSGQRAYSQTRRDATHFQAFDNLACRFKKLAYLSYRSSPESRLVFSEIEAAEAASYCFEDLETGFLPTRFREALHE